MYTQLSDHEREIAFQYQFGKFLKIDEIPCKNYFARNELVATVILSLMIVFFMLCGLYPLLLVIEGLSNILESLNPKLLSSLNLSPSSIRESPLTVLIMFGVCWGLVLWIFFVSSKLKYAERIVAFEHGLYQVKLGFFRREQEIHCRYEDIKYIRISCSESAIYVNGKRTSYTDIISYQYYMGNRQKMPFGIYADVAGCSSKSRVLFKLIGKLVKSRLMPQIMADLQSGKEVDFQGLKVSVQGIRTNQKSFFPIHQIKELRFYFDSDDDGFELEPKLEFKNNKNWGHWGSRTVYIQNIDNPHLFLEVLEMLKIPVNFDALPELANIK
ncbi:MULTISPECIES: hypothetical protein [unclassified Nodularia (in: cyanobacteria)]|uniref:hypothetical protein n=1 Tax=unclassified Nodularia (in: cyanobacteria) TaxID=2656917 RepID=UPI00187E8E33|nr:MULTISPECIES: hypothetical protein [unclassified Nodularia (in: cyanobacteria)]MBE9197875.1 hypothetical protein [Nodularia sp. LEGE 06071]MCC2694599.1 hypothetical protein [Nodularia sp. LEGE 04288]